MESNQPQPNPPVTPNNKNATDKSANNAALWAVVSGGAVLVYHAWIAIAQPREVTIWWYLSLLPIILGVSGLKSKTRKPLAIAGIVLGAISIVVIAILFTTVYEFK